MAKNSYFQFKQFRVNQDKCGMKVTSDACLFGAMVDVEHSKRILDIGAGTGLLSLMAAQRSSAHIDAVELDDSATEQTRENFLNSPWAVQLNVHHCAIQTFSADSYDTIICNPPFFTDSLKAPCEKRTLARHTDSLEFSELAMAIQRLLNSSGKAWLLLPIEAAERFIKIIQSTSELFLHQKITLRTPSKKQPHRAVLVINKEESGYTERCVAMFKSANVFSDSAKPLLEPYYLDR